MCQLCNHPSETVSHSLNGCTRYKAMYQSSHNRIVDIINNKIVPIYTNATIVKDSVLKPCNFDESYSDSFTSRECRPDVVVIDHENRRAYIVEVAVPFDAHLNLTYQLTKFFFKLTNVFHYQ